MGHALVALALPGADPVHKVSIIPRGVGALGYTIQRPTEDRFLMTREELENKMAVLLGGRARGADRVRPPLHRRRRRPRAASPTSPASMVTRYGMSERLGNVALESDGALLPVAEPAPRRPRAQLLRRDRRRRSTTRCAPSSTASSSARSTSLRERRDTLERTARRLLEKETLDEAELPGVRGPRRRPGGGAAAGDGGRIGAAPAAPQRRLASIQPAIAAAISALFFSSIIMWPLPRMPTNSSRRWVFGTPAWARNLDVQWSQVAR